MDGHRFDAWTRVLAAGASRRGLFKAAAAAAAGTLLPFGRAREARADIVCGQPCLRDPNCANSEDGCFACCGVTAEVAGVCVNTTSDPANCGGCGVACAGGQTCANGTCALQCPAGQTACGDACVDPQTDPQNCLGCGNACPAGQACCGDLGCIDLATDLHNCGACNAGCAEGQRCCAAACVDPQTDPANCGDCGVACPASQVCQNGTCVAQCPSGQTSCNGVCVDLGADRANCGACGVACAATNTCRRGACVSPCSPGQTLCGDVCADLATDSQNCGGCGIACTGNDRCQRGACLPSCAAGTTDCGGTCATLQTDRNNCGACGTVCSRETTCVNGHCIRPQCQPGQPGCDQQRPECPTGQIRCQDGCVDPKTDANHCGGCTNVCIGTLSCCDGVCVDLKADAAHCGACGKPCPPGYHCEGGGCVLRSTETGITSGRQAAFPELCQVSPRSATDLRALLSATPTPTPPRPWAEIAKGANADVHLASAELTRTIKDSVLKIAACGNADDPARQTALMTDAMASRWLSERGVTADRLAAAGSTTSTTRVPLPPGSWDVLGTIDHVYDLGQKRASALVTFEPPAPSVPPRREIHIFTEEGNRWLLHDIRREDLFISRDQTGSVLLRWFDCPPGASASDPAGACPPLADFFGYVFELWTADGSRGWGWGTSSDLPGTGLLEWHGLPPGKYALRVNFPAAPPIVIVGATKTAQPLQDKHPEYALNVHAGGYPTVVDLYRESSALSRIVAGIPIDTGCPPCQKKDSLRGVCIPTCPPCAGCFSLDIGNGKIVSSCRSLCKDDQVCDQQRHCCLPTGLACATDAACCEGKCVNGVCGCSPEGASCAGAGGGLCCPGTHCAGATKICTACQAIGASCASGDDCCDGACFDGVCRCCADVPNHDFTATHLCCEYPRAALEVYDSRSGPGFKRCCVPGFDCLEDDGGPPIAAGTRYDLSFPKVCR